MKEFGITAHCLVRNEERWIWYAIKSVINYVDRILVFDTGSTDNTVKIIKSIKSKKIKFEQKGIVNKIQFTILRQEMLDRTVTPWFMVLDGDEVWPNVAIRELVSAVKNAHSKIDAIVVPQWICQGDIFHFSREIEELREDKSGKRGFWMPRAWKKISGLQAIGEYGVESYADRDEINVSYWSVDRLKYISHKFMHMTLLQRSSSIAKDREVMMRSNKTLFSKGIQFPNSYKFPEVFYKIRPAFIPEPWQVLTTSDWIKGIFNRSLNLFIRIKNKWNQIPRYGKKSVKRKYL